MWLCAPPCLRVQDIVEWVTKKSGPATTTLEAGAQAEAFITSAPVVVIGFFTDLESREAKVCRCTGRVRGTLVAETVVCRGPCIHNVRVVCVRCVSVCVCVCGLHVHLQAFKAVATSFDDVEFGVSSSPDVATALGATLPSVALFKTFDDRRADLKVVPLVPRTATRCPPCSSPFIPAHSLTLACCVVDHALFCCCRRPSPMRTSTPLSTAMPCPWSSRSTARLVARGFRNTSTLQAACARFSMVRVTCVGASGQTQAKIAANKITNHLYIFTEALRFVWCAGWVGGGGKGCLYNHPSPCAAAHVVCRPPCHPCSDVLEDVQTVAASVKGDLLVISVDASGEAVLTELGIKQRTARAAAHGASVL